MSLKIGDLLYRVYEGFKGLEVESVRVTKFTPLYVYIEGTDETRSTTPLSFHCVGRLPRTTAEGEARSAAMAATQYLSSKLETLRELQDEITLANTLVALYGGRASE